MKDRILTGVDGSETASKAAKIAASLASDLKCDLHVMSAYDTTSVRPPDAGRLSSASRAREAFVAYHAEIEAYQDSAQKTAEEVAEGLRHEFPDVNVIAKGVDGSPSAAIIEEAERLDARIVVVGNKHVQGVSRILGSVAAAVARNIKTDLYIAHTR